MGVAAVLAVWLHNPGFPAAGRRWREGASPAAHCAEMLEPVDRVVAAAVPVLAAVVMAGMQGSWDGALPGPSAGPGWRHYCWWGVSLDLETSPGSVCT